MVISLPPEVELLVKRQVENGTYGSIEDVVMAGLSYVLAQDDLETEMSHDRLKQEILIGLEQADRGELLDFHAEVAAIRQRIHQRYGE
jgi:antitoxin ParD1/3/4